MKQKLFLLPVGRYKLAEDWHYIVTNDNWRLTQCKNGGLAISQINSNESAIIFPAGLTLSIVNYIRDGAKVAIYKSHNPGISFPSLEVRLYPSTKNWPVLDVP